MVVTKERLEALRAELQSDKNKVERQLWAQMGALEILSNLISEAAEEAASDVD